MSLATCEDKKKERKKYFVVTYFTVHPLSSRRSKEIIGGVRKKRAKLLHISYCAVALRKTYKILNRRGNDWNITQFFNI